MRGHVQVLSSRALNRGYNYPRTGPLIKGKLERFSDNDKCVPHIGAGIPQDLLLRLVASKSKTFLWPPPSTANVTTFIHTQYPYQKGFLEKQGWTVAIARYGNEEIIGAIGRDNVFATQFHSEKSGQAGLRVLEAFLSDQPSHFLQHPIEPNVATGLTRRIIACLDVRSNDAGDLVVTKSDQYDVREKNGAGGGEVRNLGKPVRGGKKILRTGG